MPRQCSKINPGYNRDSDINYLAFQLQTILYIIGLKDTPEEEISIDLIINTIKDVFFYDNQEISLAPNDLIKSINMELVPNARILWYFITYAKGILS